MAVCSREDGGAGGRTYTIVYVAVVESHAVLSKAVEIGRMVDAGAVAGYRFGSMVIGHNEDDVWAGVGRHIVGYLWIV